MVVRDLIKYLALAFVFIISSRISIIYSQSVDTVEVYSKSMQKSIKNIIIKPSKYTTSIDSFPVVYLLHGATGDFGSWLDDVPWLPGLADRYGFVLVLPDGGSTSWYFDSPIDTSFRYATYVAEELTQYVKSNYKVFKAINKNAITGLSMGGHGAFYLAATRPNTWGAAGSICGGLDFRSFPDSWDLKFRLGAKENFPNNWEHYTVINLLDQFKTNSTQLIFDCGSDDFFYEGNKNVHASLITKGIAHTFISRPGKHESAYWSSALEYQLLFFKKYFYNKKS